MRYFEIGLELLLTLGQEFIAVLSNLNPEEDGVCKTPNDYLHSHALYYIGTALSAKARCNSRH